MNQLKKNINNDFSMVAFVHNLHTFAYHITFKEIAGRLCETLKLIRFIKIYIYYNHFLTNFSYCLTGL